MVRIVVGSDHAGLKLKTALIAHLKTRGIEPVDLGTHTCLLLIGRARRGSLEVVEEAYKATRLGEGLADGGRLLPEAQERALDCLRAYRDRARELGVPEDRLRVVATAVLRRAQDAQAFQERARTELGLAIDVLGPEQEASLTWRGVASDLPAEQDALVLDLGGGSIEIAKDRGRARRSLPLGAMTLQQQWGQAGWGLEQGLQDLRSRLAAWSDLDGSGLPGYAVGGTAANLAALLGGAREFAVEGLEGRLLSASDALREARWMEAAGPEERGQRPVEAQRAPYLAAGLACLGIALGILDKSEFRFSCRGLRHGLASDLLFGSSR